MTTDRDELAAALAPLFDYSGRVPGGLACADALMPVVERIAARKAAEELRAAAEAYWHDRALTRYPEVRDWIRDRADALDPQ